MKILAIHGALEMELGAIPLLSWAGTGSRNKNKNAFMRSTS